MQFTIFQCYFIKKVAVRVGFLHFVVSFVLIIWVEYTQWLDGIVMCFHQRDHQLIATSHGEFWSSYNQDSLEVEASSELKSPSCWWACDKEMGTLPSNICSYTSTHEFLQTNSLHFSNYLLIPSNSLHLSNWIWIRFLKDLHDELHIQAICPSANTWTIPRMILLLLLLWLLY